MTNNNNYISFGGIVIVVDVLFMALSLMNFGFWGFNNIALALVIAANLYFVVTRFSSVGFTDEQVEKIRTMLVSGEYEEIEYLKSAGLDIVVKEICSIRTSNLNMLKNLGEKKQGITSTSEDVVGFEIMKLSEELTSVTAEYGELRRYIQAGELDRTFQGNTNFLRRLREELDLTYEIFNSYIYKVPAIMMTCDKEFNIKYLNEVARQALKVEKDQYYNRKCYDLFKTGDCQNDKCAVFRAMRDSRNAKSETISRPFEGVSLDIAYEGLPLFNDNRDVVGAIELVYNQTEIKTAERLAIKRADYQNNLVTDFIGKLDVLKRGELDIEFSEINNDEDVKEIATNFTEINGNLQETTDNLKLYISEIKEKLISVANGDLTRPIDIEFKGDFAEIKNSINNIIGSLNIVLGDIQEATGQVAMASDQVSLSSQSLSQGATEQASAIEEIIASISDVTEKTKENAKNAETVDGLAIEAKKVADDGNVKMQNMITSMEEIKSSSNNIASIIKVIDEIAFQTNLLALNAAVEAARAGEHGKGFAVVADEVRNLASKSAEAAKEITTMIETAINKVNDGSGIADKTSEYLMKIVDHIVNLSQLVNNINVESNNQARIMTEINEGINQISDVVQMNSATAQETAATSEEMSSQAMVLKSMIEGFKLDSGNNRSNMKKMQMNQRHSSSEKPKRKYNGESHHNDNIILEEDFGKYS